MQFANRKAPLFILGVVAATLASQTVLAVDVSVLSYNIRRGIGSNNPNIDQQPYLAKVVNHLKPDIWTIQELGGNTGGFAPVAQRVALTNFVRNNITYFGANPIEGVDYFVYVGQQSDGFIGNAIVSKYPILSTDTSGDGLRGLVRATIDIPGNIDMGVFTTHLKAFNDTASAQERQGNANLSRSNLLSWRNLNPDKVAVLTGDFNETEDPEDQDNWSGGVIGGMLPNGQIYRPVSTLKSAGFLDGVPRSRNNDNDTIDSSGPNPTKRFDYNLYSDDGKISYLGGEVFNIYAYPFGQQPPGFGISDTQLASDHLAVMARYQVVPEPSTILGSCVGLAALLRKKRRSTPVQPEPKTTREVLQ